MKTQKKRAKQKHDREEKKLLSSFEKDKWKSVKNLEQEKTRARKPHQEP